MSFVAIGVQKCTSYNTITKCTMQTQLHLIHEWMGTFFSALLCFAWLIEVKKKKEEEERIFERNQTPKP
jgi:hypothetical protein